MAFKTRTAYWKILVVVGNKLVKMLRRFFFCFFWHCSKLPFCFLKWSVDDMTEQSCRKAPWGWKGKIKSGCYFLLNVPDGQGPPLMRNSADVCVSNSTRCRLMTKARSTPLSLTHCVSLLLILSIWVKPVGCWFIPTNKADGQKQ